MDKKASLKIFVIIGLIIVAIFILYFATRSAEPEFKCGNGICDYRETITCPRDCPSGEEPICGDGECDVGEVCQVDCGGQPQEYCGDGICQYDEDSYSCPTDCGVPIPECGNGECEVFSEIDEFLVCPQDCGIICGDGECVIDPYDERKNCPQDCNINIVCGNGICQEGESQLSCPQDCKEQIDNEDLIYKLNQKQRPLVAGLRTTHERTSGFSQCTLGMIVKSNGKNYLLTAGHCVTKGEDGMPDSQDIGLWVKQGDETIGSVYKIDNSGGVDGALVSISGTSVTTYKDFLGNTINGWGTATKGLRVYKVGATTGYTTGTITDTNLYYTDKNGNKIRGFEVTGDSGEFSVLGDSGSAIITLNSPHKIIGIISAGSGSNLPEDIKSRLDID